MTLRILFIFLVTVGLSQCKVKKNTTSNNEFEKIITDEIVVHGNTKSSKGEAPYQPSTKRVNDILHTVLDIRFNYEKQQVIGKATLTIKPYFYPTSVLDLDARNFTINRVALITTDTQNLSFTYDSLVIHINLSKEYKNTDTYKIFIDYIAKPNENKQKGSAAISDAKGIYFINPLKKEADKPRQIWTQGETQSNSGWFPTNDVPNEKMTQEIYITADEKDVTLSNGELIYSRINNDKTHTDYWKQSLPHSPYLTMMAVGEFAIVKDSWRDSIEVNYYVEPAYKPYAKLIFGHTPEMLDFFSTRLGVDYPWEKFSQIVVRDFVSGAMENTSAVVHFDGLQHDAREHLDVTHEDIISHELFHHWFGDLVTCESWSNIPLNESFATYGSYLWDEHKYGRMEADYNFDENLNAYLGQKIKHKTKLIRFNYKTREDMFDVVSYQKGSRVLHMLRNYVGDDAFFKSLQLYLTRHKYTNVEIHNLRLAFEEVTGEDLNWFFNQWFLGAGHPILTISYEYDVEHKNVTVLVEQKQDTLTNGVFRLPIAIDMYSNGKVTRKKVVIEKANESFSFQSAQPIDLINVDADKVLLAVVTDMKPMEEYVYMLQHAPLFIDKQNAANGIIANMPDSITKDITTCIQYAINHEYYGVREIGLELIDKLNDKDRAVYAEKVRAIAEHDNKASLRTDAIEILRGINATTYKNVFVNATNDSAYSVVAAGLSALSEIDTEQALKLAENYKTSKNGNIQALYANIISENGKGDYIAYFESTFGKYGYNKYSILSSYGTYLKRSDTTIVLKAIPGLKAYYQRSKDNDLFVRLIIPKLVTDLQTPYADAITEAQNQQKKLKANDPKQTTLTTEITNNKRMLYKLNQIVVDGGDN